jgi:hypothetical protein
MPMLLWSQLCLDLDVALKCRRTKHGVRSVRLEIEVQNADNRRFVRLGRHLVCPAFYPEHGRGNNQNFMSNLPRGCDAFFP